jgi:hypothetical protein
MTKLPAKPESPAQSVNERIAKLRKATGRPERLERTMRCSRTSKDYFVTFERFNQEEPFKVMRIEKEAPVKDGVQTAAPAVAAAKSLPCEMIDNDGLKCPWCGAGGSVYHGTCGITWCDSAKRTVNGEILFTCLQCKLELPVSVAKEYHNLRDAPSFTAAGLLSGAASLVRLGRKS